MSNWKRYCEKFELDLSLTQLNDLKLKFKTLKERYPSEWDEAFGVLLNQQWTKPFMVKDVQTQIDYQLKKKASKEEDPQALRAKEWRQKYKPLDENLQAKSKECTDELCALYCLVKTGEKTVSQAISDFWIFASERAMKEYFERDDINWLLCERFELLREVVK